MPKRIVDGDALWKSDKLSQLPNDVKAEYANLIPLALANGSFECNPRLVWSKVYAYNRPEVTLEMTERILLELERVKLLFRWTDDPSGKIWGFWVGIDKPGRLPGDSRRGTNEKVGMAVPGDELSKFLGINGFQKLPDGNEKLLGLGSGLGFGLGSGLGSGCTELFQLPLNDGTFFPITDSQIAKWTLLYPAVDVGQALRSMIGWSESNPTKRKTARGIQRFVNSWLDREQNRPRSERNNGNGTKQSQIDAIRNSREFPSFE